MARKLKPDHAGRMPDHSRYGNPSDPDEEANRILKAYENLGLWEKKYGSELSGGVKMSYGTGPAYEVPIGDKQIAQKIVSRPIAPPSDKKALPDPAESAPELPPVFGQKVQPRQFWLWRLVNRITGAR